MVIYYIGHVYLRPYVYSFCQTFQALCLFPVLRLFWRLEYLGLVNFGQIWLGFVRFVWLWLKFSFGWQSIIKNSELLETFKNIYWDSLMQLLSLNCTWLYFKYCSSIVKSFWHVYLICPIFLMHLIFCNALLQQFSLDGPWISLFTRILDF